MTIEDPFQEAKNRCDAIEGCTMLYYWGGNFKTCPHGSTIVSKSGSTLHTRGKL